MSASVRSGVRPALSIPYRLAGAEWSPESWSASSIEFGLRALDALERLSKCVEKHVGGLELDEHAHILDRDHNGSYPDGGPCGQSERGPKYNHCEHAEDKLLRRFRQSEDYSRGIAIWTSLSPCPTCAGRILTSRNRACIFNKPLGNPYPVDPVGALIAAGISVFSVKGSHLERVGWQNGLVVPRRSPTAQNRRIDGSPIAGIESTPLSTEHVEYLRMHREQFIVLDLQIDGLRLEADRGETEASRSRAVRVFKEALAQQEYEELCLVQAVRGQFISRLP